MSEPTATPTKPPRGQFKCFHCRKLYPMKDGNWHFWQSYEVHLCKKCEIETRNSKERKK